ncbi:MAG: hypothetical protein QOI14_1899, partial [Actinomycetota bacterium]|nr:hypothetical protein [Actinomycetota bacterium]
EKSQLAGCEAYIAKPLRYRELHAAIDALLTATREGGNSADQLGGQL